MAAPSGYWDRTAAPIQTPDLRGLPQSAPSRKSRPANPRPARIRLHPIGLGAAAAAGDLIMNAANPDANRRPTPPRRVAGASFLRTSAVLASGLAALAASLSPLRHMNDFPTVEQFLQKYYKELTPRGDGQSSEAHRGRSRARNTACVRMCAT